MLQFLKKTEVQYAAIGAFLPVLGFISRSLGRYVQLPGFLEALISCYWLLSFPGILAALLIGGRSLSPSFLLALACAVNVVLYGSLFYGIGAVARRFGWKIGVLGVILALVGMFFLSIVLFAWAVPT